MVIARSDEVDVAAERRTLIRGFLIAAPIVIAAWLALYWLIPPISAPTDTAKLVLAVRCTCFASLLVIFTGIEAVAHARLTSAAIDPLAGHETRRIQIDQHYLQNSVEQILLFAPGLFGLASYSGSGSALRAVPIATAIWIVTRIVFWLGYRVASKYRGAGLVGMAQSVLILFYVSIRAGYDALGFAGGAAPVIFVLATEYWLLRSGAHTGE